MLIQAEYSKNSMEQSFFLTTKSPVFQKALEDCRRVSSSPANILVIGPSGCGKEVAVKYIHACGKRSQRPFIAVNCSTFTETLLESELFGHEKGAFTGAIKSREGKFEISQGGTLFLDEIGDLSLSTQIKLLRAIESKTIERIGSNTSRKIEFRLISATNKDFYGMLKSGGLRADFFYRISTIVIKIPSLIERSEDIPDLIQYFLKQSQIENECEVKKIHPEVMDFLLSYNYPGNIRELRNIIDRMVVLSKDGEITREQMPILYNMDNGNALQMASPLPIAVAMDNMTDIITWREFKGQSEKQYLQWVLKKVEGSVAKAATYLEITPRQIFNKIKKYGLNTHNPS